MRKLRTWRLRSEVMAGSSVGPSTPQFQRAVVVGAVLVALAVGLVVLGVVADEVGQGEAVVGGDEVDAGPGAPAGGLVEVRAAGQAVGQLADGRALLAPVVPHGVAVAAVPLRPEHGEVPHLVPARAEVPRFGDELDLADHRVLVDQVEESRELVDLVELPGEAGREVEAEAVDVHFQHPVAQ